MVSMIAHNMAIRYHSFYQIRACFKIISYNEKGGRSVVLCAAVRPPQKEAQKSRAQAAAVTALRRREDPGAPCEFINFLGDRKEKKDGFIEKRPGFDDVTTNI